SRVGIRRLSLNLRPRLLRIVLNLGVSLGAARRVRSQHHAPTVRLGGCVALFPPPRTTCTSTSCATKPCSAVRVPDIPAGRPATFVRSWWSPRPSGRVRRKSRRGLQCSFLPCSGPCYLWLFSFR